MDTPIYNYVNQYAQQKALRLHMPGHKGQPLLGVEPLDITEIEGADSLYEASGIIRESEANASRLFGCDTFYSTEGSSQCIRAMLYLALLWAKASHRRPLIAAGRNAHKTFLSAVALLDLEVTWLYPPEGGTYLSCPVDPADLEAVLEQDKPAAVYLTSPDYLGNVADIAAIGPLCRRYGTLLLVDNAHGAYLRFLHPSRHPIDLGADLCCDSAHKTLPVLTGGAYLHISPAASTLLSPQAKKALALFGSTSPSYLILQSLDLANRYLAEDYPRRLENFCREADRLKCRLAEQGWRLTGSEPLKLTLCPKSRGYTGTRLAACLREQNIMCEFSDPDHLVMMLTPDPDTDTLSRLETALLSIPGKPPISGTPPKIHRCQQILTVREAVLRPSQTLPAETCVGRILADSSVGCPPAVPILICGEQIDRDALACFHYYGIAECAVVTE